MTGVGKLSALSTGAAAFVGVAMLYAGAATWARTDVETQAAEQLTAHTMVLAEAAPRPAARIEELAWLAGEWRGAGLGGDVEERWSSPSAGTMVGTFKLVAEDGTPAFYEFMTILEVDGTLELRLKHFGPDLTGWEDEADYVRFPLVRVGSEQVWFRGLTYARRDGTLNVHLARQTDDGYRELAFAFTGG